MHECGWLTIHRRVRVDKESMKKTFVEFKRQRKLLCNLDKERKQEHISEGRCL